ncbi:unnamed protein product [Arabis nemorensis]|uniref:RRM domain-containing protein n=1 Tax=Arabis nemorensis TaxID=586526 RepID=A0A565B2N3_9BRAS|nr:unnamed protein product [Arabis nemorensis]
MGKKHKKSSTSTDDDVKAKKHKKSSTATDENYEDEIIVSKNEFKEMKKSIKVLSEVVKKLQEILPTKADLLEFSLKENAIPKKNEEAIPKTKEEEEFTCCFECEEATRHNDQTLLVKGFDNVRPRDDIKNDLIRVFGSLGEITRVFVPMECKTGVPLGFAFIDLKNGQGNEKALELNKSYVYGRKIKVKMAKDSDKFYGFRNFGGCRRCYYATKVFSPPEMWNNMYDMPM